MQKRLLFFLRHNNDIDQITPVIWKWHLTTDIPAVVVISNTSSINIDYRVKLLKSQENITVYLIDELIEKYKSRYGESSIKSPAVLESGGQKKLNTIKKHILRYSKVFYPIIQEKKGNKNQEHFARFLLSELMGDVDQGLVIFDWISDNMMGYFDFAKPICDEARQKGFLTVSLPHGDEPHYCKMIRKDELDLHSPNLYQKAKYLFDYLVVPNELCAARYKNQMPEERVKVFGSPRYNDEWIGVNKQLMPKDEMPGKTRVLKVVFFLRSFAYPIFWEEVERTIQLIKNFKEIYLTVIHHPRGKELLQQVKPYPELRPREESNLSIITSESPSSAWIHWADVVLDVGTSAVFEAVKLDKPVLELEYLHATYTTISHYMPGCVMMCRDHLYDTLKLFLTDGCERFYNSEERNRFIREVIDISDDNVLDRYVNFMYQLLE